MDKIVITDLAATNGPARAPQGTGTNALVHSPFAFEAIAPAGGPARAPQGTGTNALVHSPFAFAR